ncbi:NAD(+) diphosphatase [Aliidiomarina taiwanensis]|uniref:NAD(+) diphosphatase n=1 Tax=Aliidiomarina taiwanensis TaxID=946228 RepID=A0A432WYS7_9GAMM|nr:NAD(+) diphosphatase [Aliidiomarina taiwanensis]RUO38906.1 NAD(+) diphosphatase [Aliidiomarina taiwanensis]
MIFPDRMPPEKEPVWWIIVHNNQLIDTTPEGQSFRPPLLAVEDVPYASHGYTAEIGQYQGRPVFLLIGSDSMPLQAGWTFLPLRQCILRSDKELFSLSARGCQITGFLDTHKFCGRCGEQVAQHRRDLAVVCGYCGLESYPRISPCIIVGIYKEDKILLAQGVRHPEGTHSVLAGFVESGESLEECVHREVFEEAGITVTDLEYVGSQPWPFPHSLMAGFIARYAGGELKLDPEELVTGGWFAFDNLPKAPAPGSIAAKLIEVVRKKVGGELTDSEPVNW